MVGVINTPHGFETICYTHGFENKKNSWSNANAVLSGVGGQKFKSRTGQIEHMVANGSPPLRYFFERSCVARAQWLGNGPR